MVANFTEFTACMEKVHEEKGKGYDGDEQYSTHWAIEEVGLPGWASPVNRIREKLQRLTAALNKVQHSGAAKDVDVDEELVDIANLAGIAWVMRTRANDRPIR